MGDTQFPGKREPVNRGNKPSGTTSPGPDPDWDLKPKILLHGGQAVEFFQIGHLANALGVKPVTIRSWENRGAFPRTPFRTPPPRNQGAGRENGKMGGTSRVGKRLWSREMIEATLAVAAKHKVIIDPKRTPPTEQFTFEITQIFLKITQQELDNSK